MRAAEGAVRAEELPRMEWNGPQVVGNTVCFIENKASAYELPSDISAPFEPKHIWTTRVPGSRHYASPVVHDSLIYTVSRETTLSTLDAESGELVYEKELKLGGGGGNRVYYLGRAGR